MAENSLFIVIEGLDGAGKTSIARQLYATLSQTHTDRVALTYEPHDPSAAGLYIRNTLTKRIKVSPQALALAFALNRADHIDQIINPLFATSSEPRIVICDRYVLSSLVYQSTGGLTMDDIYGLNCRARQPDLTLLLNVSPHQCYARMRNRPQDRELFEKNLAERAEKYQLGAQLLRDRGQKIVEIDANPGEGEVFSAVLKALRENGPPWLRIQKPLLLDNSDSDNIADPEIGDDELRQWVADLASDQIANLSSLQVNRLFKAYLLEHGYGVGERLTFAATAAYSLNFELPAGIELQGIALILDEYRHSDHVTKLIHKLWDKTGKSGRASRACDFMIVLDKTQFEPFSRFDRDLRGRRNIMPAIQVVTRQALLEWCLQRVAH